MIAFLDRLGLTAKRRESFVKFLVWFKQPSNLLSVVAILAVVIVPWLEKVAKSDETLRAKVDALLETTNKVISFNQQRTSASPSDFLGTSLISAQRQNELARATAIAESIKHEVYPVVLFALSNELCASGRYDEGLSYLQEVLNRGAALHFLSARPSVEELAQAHVLRAHCYTDQSQGGVEISAQDKKRTDDEMASAVKLLDHGNDEHARGQLAITFADWAEANERMGDKIQAESHRTKAREIAQAMRFPDPMIIAIVGSNKVVLPQPPPTLNENALPRSPDGDTYKVDFPEYPEEAGALILPNLDPQQPTEFGGVLYCYHRGLFGEVYEVNSWKLNGPAITRLDFEEAVPNPASPSSKTHKIQLVWTIEKMEKGTIVATQSKVGQTSRRLVARLSASAQPNAKNVTN